MFANLINCDGLQKTDMTFGMRELVILFYIEHFIASTNNNITRHRIFIRLTASTIAEVYMTKRCTELNLSCTIQSYQRSTPTTKN